MPIIAGYPKRLLREDMRQRDEWIAMEIFNEYGYDDFLAEAANLSEEFRNSVRPCDSRREP